MSEPTWEGYWRPDGRKGVRNLVLVIHTLECAAHVSHEMARGEEEVHVVGFPCCSEDARASRMLLDLARHPNVGAVLAVGLGCERASPARLAEHARESGRPAEWFHIQDRGGTRAGIEHGKGLVRRLRETVRNAARRVPMTMADLTVGAAGGGTDATTGAAGQPVVGAFLDRLVSRGGRAVQRQGVLDLLAEGAQVLLFVTGCGSVIGSPIAPLIKITGNPRTFEQLREDLDFNAGRVLNGEITLDQAAEGLLGLVAAVAAGRPSRAEALGHRECSLMHGYAGTRCFEASAPS